MLVASLSLALAKAPGPALPPEPGAFEAPEPILEQAELDVKAMRAGRVAFVFGASAPFVAHVGGVAFAPTQAPGVVAAPTDGIAYGLLGLGGTAMIVAPWYLDQRAQRSRKLLLEQGLTVRKVSSPLVSGLVGLVGAGLMTAGTVGSAGEVRGLRVALGYTATAASLALGTRQVAVNRQARIDAGWIEDGR